MGPDCQITRPYADMLVTAPTNFEQYEALYKYFHQHPELSNLEAKTAKTIAAQLSRLQGFRITTNIGGHGVVGVLENGPGNTLSLSWKQPGFLTPALSPC